MAEGGYDEQDPLLDHTDDRNDDGDDGDTTGTFQPAASSSRRPSGEQIPMRTTTTNRPSERGGTAETSFIEGPGNLTRQFRLDEAQKKIKYHFPNYNENIDLTINDKGRIVAKGPRGGDIEVFKEDKKSLLAGFMKFADKVKETFGLPREAYLDQLKKGEGDRKKYIADQQKILDDTSEDSGKKALADKGIKKAQLGIERIEKLISEVESQKNPGEKPDSIELRVFTQNEEKRDERLQEIQQKRQEQEEIAQDKNRPQAERVQARENLEGLDQQVNEIENEREREIEQLPLRERLREKVKAIFKKYGFTVTAVFLAVGTTIGVILSSLSSGLKSVADGVGNGLKELGKKLGSILPGLLGSIASFVFRTAGQVISFLGKNAWLLILAVAAFLIERVTKR